MTGRAGNQQPPAYQQQYTSPPLTMQQIQQLQQLQAQQQHTLRMRASGGQQIRPGGPQRGNFFSKTHRSPVSSEWRLLTTHASAPGHCSWPFVPLYMRTSLKRTWKTIRQCSAWKQGNLSRLPWLDFQWRLCLRTCSRSCSKPKEHSRAKTCSSRIWDKP